MMLRITIAILLCASLQSIEGVANNSLSNCKVIADRFNSTCNGTAVANIIETTGMTIYCDSGFTNATCPGMIENDTCVFEHKLCVTCSSGAMVRIRVQSNGLPPFCPNVSGSIQELNIDFEVNFNPDVNVNSLIQAPTSTGALNTLVCNSSTTASVPSGSNLTSYTNSSILSSLVGVSLDGVSILNVNSVNNIDSLYPVGNYTVEKVDACLGHVNPSNQMYHYYTASGCALNGSVGHVSSCQSNANCNASLANYTISMFSSYPRLTVIGIAKDGHVIYGPYDSTSMEITTGFDVCNGMFYDSIGNYAYFATRTYPYVIGCFGPGNYPTVVPTCTTNAPKNYSKSIYALNQTTTLNKGNCLRFQDLMTVMSISIMILFIAI